MADAVLLVNPPWILFDDPGAISQVYWVPSGTTPLIISSGVIDENVSPSQIVSLKLLIWGTGLIVIVKFWDSPVQKLVDGVTEYVIRPTVLLEVEIEVCSGIFPVPFSM